MANNYVEFSELVENVTPEEMEWFEEYIEKINKEEEDDGEGMEFEMEIRGSQVWIYVEEYGSVDAVADMMVAFLAAHRPDACWGLTFSESCSKPRVGEFGGGAIFCTAKDWDSFGTYGWVQQQVAKFAGE